MFCGKITGYFVLITNCLDIKSFGEAHGIEKFVNDIDDLGAVGKLKVNNDGDEQNNQQVCQSGTRYDVNS